MNEVTETLKNWQDYKSIRVCGNSRPTVNAKKLISLFSKDSDSFKVESIRSGNWYGRETGILLIYKTPEAFVEIKKLFKEFCESLGYKYSRSSTMFYAKSAEAVYDLENTQNFCGLYRNLQRDKYLNLDIVFIKLVEF